MLSTIILFIIFHNSSNNINTNINTNTNIEIKSEINKDLLKKIPDNIYTGFTPYNDE